MMEAMKASLFVLMAMTAIAQMPPLPAPMSVPKPGAVTDAPYSPQPILPGGVVVPLYPPGSPYLKMDKVREPEVYNLSQTVAGRINSIVGIHNPSIEVHLVDKSLNTGAALILVAGGGHNTLNVGGESADFVPFFYNYGVNTIILRNRLRRDGYNPQTDAVNDALQAVRLVRAYAKEWNIDPNKIGMMGFSAGAELVAAAAVLFEEFDKKDVSPNYPFNGASDARRAERRDASLRQRPPPGRPAARWQPHDRRPDRPFQHALRHVADSLHRLVPRPGFPAEAGHRNQGRQGRRNIRKTAADPGAPPGSAAR